MERIGIATSFIILAISAWLYKNSSYPSSIITDTVSDEYDYIVVGGGSAGSVMASRLSEEKTNTVLLLEAGGFFDENPISHIPLVWLGLLRMPDTWKYYTVPQSHSSQGLNDKQSFWPRGRVLGGTGAINGMTYARGSPFDFDEWAANGCTGWSYKDVLPYFIKSEDILVPELQKSKYHGTGGPLAVSSGKATPLSEMYLKAGEEMGYPITDYNSADIVGFSEIQMNVRNGVRSSTGVEFLGNIDRRKNLDISINSFVTKIALKEQVAKGVYFIKDSRKHYVRARKEVIVSGGTINSPQLLMLSGIGPKAHLTELGIPVIADLPVGENLQDHIFVLLQTKINKPISFTDDLIKSVWNELVYKLFKTGPFGKTGNEAVAFIHLDKNMQGKTYPDIQLIFSSFLVYGDMANLEKDMLEDYMGNFSSGHGFSSFLFLSHPKSKGFLKLKSTDPFDYPIIDPRFLSDEKDVDTLVAGIKYWDDFLKTKTMKGIGAQSDDLQTKACAKYKFKTNEYWQCYVRHFAITAYHHSGTCKMGSKDDPTAVVDEELRVQGIKGLRVVDASIFPSMPSGNTNAPAIMVAEKAADIILKQDTVKHIRNRLRDM